jgi:membrane-bound lytic murein transglycosylase A
MKNIFLLPIIILLFASCTIKEIKKQPWTKSQETVEKPVYTEPKTTIKPIVKVQNPDFSKVVKALPKDDKDFLTTLSYSKSYYSKASVQEANFTYDDKNYTGKEMLKSLELFEKCVTESASLDEFISKLNENFDLYESKNEKNSSLITGYYAPVLKGSLEKTDKYNAPLYPVPKDLITVNLKKFSQRLPNKEIVGRLDGNQLVPYYTREEIEAGALKDTKPLAYVDNKVDELYLEIQGSGFLVTDDGKEYNIGYAGRNGRPYSSIGGLIAREKLIPSDTINMYTIREYLLTNPDEIPYVLGTNESFVFFKIRQKEGVFGNIGVKLTAKNSVAMDYTMIPRGSLVYIKTKIPYKQKPDDQSIPRSQREPFEKFFLVQDTGGAIKGGGRVDIYFGEGDDAFFYASQMAGRGDVYLIVAKKEKLPK